LCMDANVVHFFQNFTSGAFCTVARSS
jgi:hypothetical protein